jgi:hypothetical protein
MSEGPDKESKTEDPTGRKLDDARKKGDVAKSHGRAAMDVAGRSLRGDGDRRRVDGADLAHKLLPFIASPHAFEMSGEGARTMMWRRDGDGRGPHRAVMLTAAVAGAAEACCRPGCCSRRRRSSRT